MTPAEIRAGLRPWRRSWKWGGAIPGAALLIIAAATILAPSAFADTGSQAQSAPFSLRAPLTTGIILFVVAWFLDWPASSSCWTSSRC